ncbi:MAG: hypothetical protein KIG53_06620, partial [Oscillospiraceae bacterium]|nr:hypothetical protein [Oscillospiraceae bacterium]
GQGVYDGYYHIILSGVEINEEATEYTKLTNVTSMGAYISRNYYCGKAKISLGCDKYYLKENKYYLSDNTIEVNNGTSNSNTFIYTDDDEFVAVNGNVKFRTRIIGKNDIVVGSSGGYGGYNKLVRKVRETPYYVNGIGKIQRITNMDMMTPPYDGSFNPDESLKYPSKTNIKINGNNYICSVITAKYDDYRNYSDNVPCFTKISNIIRSTNADERYVVDKTSGMLIDYATRSYKGTIYGTEDTTNPAYGEEAPETAVSAPVANELYYHITNSSNYQGVYYLYDADISSWVECSFAALTDTF